MSPQITSSEAAAMAGMREGAVWGSPGNVFVRLGLGDGTYSVAQDYARATEIMDAFPVGTRFGVRWGWPAEMGGGGHAIAAEKMQFGTVFFDYQSSPAPLVFMPGAPSDTEFFIWILRW